MGYFDDLKHIAEPWKNGMPQLVMEGDAPRTRKSDPVASHQAGDVSQRTLQQTKARVLQVVHANPGITGTEVNDLYRLMGARKEWERVAYDTPRKRAGELAADGYLEVVGERVGLNNQPEAIYELSEYGRKVVTLGKSQVA